MENIVARYFRCPPDLARYTVAAPVSQENSFFKLGRDTVGYGRCNKPTIAPDFQDGLFDALTNISVVNDVVTLPFDPAQVAETLRCELYVADWRGTLPLSLIAQLYYFIRPILPVFARRHLQKIHFKTRRESSFPRWPVDPSIDNMFRQILRLTMESQGIKQVPFIWFWPDGAPCGAIMTHDVESELGRNYCDALMDIDDSFGIKASFQIIPEERYSVSPEFLDRIRDRGFEIAIHDLNHDGHLYKNRNQFLARARKINAYGAEYKADGFRAAVLYRKQLWYDALRFAFDMSVPNVAKYDPQRGGCCTVMPYFLGDVLELPVTMCQDYTLFNIIGIYSIDLWTEQIEIIMNNFGLISCIIHPDYIFGKKEMLVYEQLLSYMSKLRDERGIWVTTPTKVNRWWRAREQMSLTLDHGSWRIAGPESSRARVAFARIEGGELRFQLAPRQ